MKGKGKERKYRNERKEKGREKAMQILWIETTVKEGKEKKKRKGKRREQNGEKNVHVVLEMKNRKRRQAKLDPFLLRTYSSTSLLMQPTPSQTSSGHHGD